MILQTVVLAVHKSSCFGSKVISTTSFISLEDLDNVVSPVNTYGSLSDRGTR